jgi:hypothetical protein
MSFSQLFPLKDTTLYSLYPTLNAGIDPILDLSKPNNYNADRFLIQFDQGEIINTITQNIIPTITGSESWKAYLRVYVTEAESLPTNLPILCDAVYSSWDMGTGRFGNIPTTKNGASWLGPKQNSFWQFDGVISTGSYSSGSFGGGDWYVGYTNQSYLYVSSSYLLNNYIKEPAIFNGSTLSQSITYYTPQDIYLDVTNIVKGWYDNLINNNGFILRVSESIENNPNYTYQLSYFSRDTNTIYPPSLLFYWNSQKYYPNTQSILQSDTFNVSLGNNGGTFQSGENVKFRVYSREKYPPRTFVTQSLYTYNKTLPPSSWYQIIDIDTNEAVIPFNHPGTLLNADLTSSYFNLNTSVLEPERYYTVQIKTEINGNTFIETNNNMQFKTRQVV